MSLINQMLRDLEQRTSQQPNPSQPLNIQTPHQAVKRNKPWLWLLPVIALACVYLWRHDQTRQFVALLSDSSTATHPAQSQTPPAAMPIVQTETATLNIATIEIPAEAPQTQPLTLTAEAIAPQPKTSVQPATHTESAEQHEPPSPSQTAESVKSKVEKIVPSQHKTPALSDAEASPTQRAETLYHQAQNQPSIQSRIATLQKALQLNPEHLAARNLLLQNLLKANSAELDGFLLESLELFPEHLPFITTRAHLQIQRKDFAAAGATLERLDSQSVNDSTYLSLLAASYQQQHRFPQANEIYHRLTQLEPEKAEHWLGLGICAENLQQRQTAIDSYRQALDKNTLNDSVVVYINQRLSALK